MNFKHFEFNLERHHFKKVGITSNALLVMKLNRLLELQGERPLGFTELEVPDQSWLYKVARYIDQTNILEFFETQINPEPPLGNKSSQISTIYYGRLFACQWLFRLQTTKTNKKLWEMLKNLSEVYRTLMAQRINAELLEQEVRHNREKSLQLETSLQDLIGKAALTYSAIENPNINPQMVISGSKDFTDDMKAMLHNNARL